MHGSLVNTFWLWLWVDWSNYIFPVMVSVRHRWKWVYRSWWTQGKYFLCWCLNVTETKTIWSCFRVKKRGNCLGLQLSGHEISLIKSPNLLMGFISQKNNIHPCMLHWSEIRWLYVGGSVLWQCTLGKLRRWNTQWEPTLKSSMYVCLSDSC